MSFAQGYFRGSNRQVFNNRCLDSCSRQRFKGGRVTLAGSLLAVMLLGCSRPDGEPRPPAHTSLPSPAPIPAAPSASDPHSPSHAAAAAHGSAQAVGSAQGADVVWTVPQGWTTLPARMMRKATYEAPGPAGAAEIGVFYFGPGQGGGVEPNIERWVNQFADASPAQRSEETIHGMKAVTVEIDKGTFQSGMPGGPTTPRTEWALYGSIVDTPVGAYFFKMTGPRATVAQQKAQLKAMLATLTVQPSATP